MLLGAATRRRNDGSETAYRCEGALYEPRTAHAEAVVLLRFLPKESSSSRFVALTQKIGELSSEISRRQRAEQEVRGQRELLHVTISSIGDAVIATDRDRRVTFMNGVAEQLTGWTAAEAMQTPVSEIFNIINEDSREQVEDPVAKVLASGQTIGLANHTLLIARDGTERPIDDSGAPIVDAEGRLYGVVLVFRDVTELRAVQCQERAARTAAEAASREGRVSGDVVPRVTHAVECDSRMEPNAATRQARGVAPVACARRDRTQRRNAGEIDR